MQSLFTFVSPPGPCGYLPDREWQLRYEVVGALTREEYQARLLAGWRRFGHSLFRPECVGCRACQSIRVCVPEFAPNRSQRRAIAANADVRIEVGEPCVTDEKLRLYDRFHAFQAGFKHWPEHAREDANSYAESFVANPYPTDEWCYYVGDRLVGVGYVDPLPAGPSAIYFFYDPDERQRSLGTFNVLSVLRRAKADGAPHLYLGYFVDGCRSLEYKGNFLPNERLSPAGWRPFRSG